MPGFPSSVTISTTFSTATTTISSTSTVAATTVSPWVYHMLFAPVSTRAPRTSTTSSSTTSRGLRDVPASEEQVFAHPDTGLHFQPIGRMVGSLHFGHVSFDMDLLEIENHFA
jgi:hypothetical protein